MRVKARKFRRSNIQRLREQFGAHRHGDFGRGRGRGRAAVGREIDQRGIGFMAHGGDQRDRAFGGRAHDDLLVERHQIFDGAAAARDDEHIGTRNRAAWFQRVEAANGGGDLARRASRPAPPPATAARGGESARSAGA